jgi:hypothetical protein
MTAAELLREIHELERGEPGYGHANVPQAIQRVGHSAAFELGVDAGYAAGYERARRRAISLLRLLLAEKLAAARAGEAA